MRPFFFPVVNSYIEITAFTTEAVSHSLWADYLLDVVSAGLLLHSLQVPLIILQGFEHIVFGLFFAQVGG